jgi:hypothetical protein
VDPGLRDAVLGATNIQAPASPIGAFPELAQMYQSSFQLPQSGGAAGILTAQADTAVAQQKEAAKKKNYQRVKKKDGGFAFFDPDGNEVSAYDYANALDKNPSEVLADSENPIDLGYQQDYKNLQDYINSKLNAKFDEKSRTKAEKIEQQIRDNYGIDVNKMKPEELIERFKQAYPTVYGRKNTGVQAGQTLIPKIPTSEEIDLTGGGSIGGL